MKEKRFGAKILLAVLAVIMLLGSMSVLSFAASTANTQENLKGSYGLLVPTDSKLKAQKKSYTFYGDSCKLYFMRISKGKKNAKFAVEIYSDNQYKNKIRSFSSSFDTKAGNKALSISWPFKDVKSGTYYGRCYVYKENEDGSKKIDSSSYEKFTININRVGKREVPLVSLKNTVSGTKITWKKVPTAEKYYVYRKVAGNKSWTKIKTTDANATSYTDTKANSGNRYTYTVKCFDGKYNSLYKKSGLTTVFLDAPVLKNAEGSSASGYAKISWSKVAGASGYIVYRKGGSLSDYEYKRVATIKGGSKTSYTDKTAKSTDWNYTYTVKAYQGSIYSGYSSKGVDFDYLPAPTIKKVSSYNTGMRIEWTNKNDNIVKYAVYVKQDGKWTKLATTKNEYYIHTKAASNKSYTYTVKGFSDTNGGAYNSKGKTAKFIGTPDVKPITFNSDGASVVKWNKIAGAVGYKVYRKIDGASNWSTIATVVGNAKTSYTDKVAKTSGSTYTYTVRAYDINGTMGHFILNGITGTFLSTPSFTAKQITTEDKTLAVNIAWEEVKGASSYNVYRRLPGEDWAVIAKQTKELSFIDSQVENGVVYDYTVKAVAETGETSSGKTVSAYAITVPEINAVEVISTGTQISWNSIPGATGYNVYRINPETGEETLADTVEVINPDAEVCTYTDTAEGANKYYYAVSTVVGKLESSKSAKAENFVNVTAEAVFNSETQSIILKWTADEDAVISAQKSLVGENPEATDIIIDGESSGTYEDLYIEEGSYYTYTVTADKAGKLPSTVSVTEKYPHPPLAAATITDTAVTNSTDTAECIISWTAVEFADQYVILRAPVKGDEYGEYAEIATVLNDAQDENGIFSYTDSGIPADGKYAYVIKAVATESERDSSVSQAAEIEVFVQLAAVSDLKVSSSLDEDGFKVLLEWAPTELAEKYTVSRIITATGTEEILAEILPEEVAEGEEAILKTFYTDTAADNNVNYIYTVTAYAENRGEVSNDISFCNGEAMAYYKDYNNAKSELSNLLGESNIDENGGLKYVADVYDEVKSTFEETDANLSKVFAEGEEAQATIDGATSVLNELIDTLNKNVSFTVTFVLTDGSQIKAEVKDGTAVSDIQDKPNLPENTAETFTFGWADKDKTIISEEITVTDDITLYVAIADKLIFKDDATASFKTESVDDKEYKYIDGVAQKTTVADIKAQLRNDLTYVEVTDYLGNLLADDAIAGTGTTITIKSEYTDEIYDTAYVVILGDLNGDGEVTQDDITISENAATDPKNAYTFNGVYMHCFFIANDVDGDGALDFDTLFLEQLIIDN